MSVVGDEVKLIIHHDDMLGYMQKLKRFVEYLPVIIIITIIGIGGFTVLLTKKQITVTMKNVAITTDAQFVKTVSESMITIDPSSVQLASVDLNGDGSEDYRVALYKFQTKDNRLSGFQVYDSYGNLDFEDNSSIWSSNPTNWRWVKIGDADGNGDNEIYILGTEAGTGAYTHQIILNSSLPGMEKISDSILD